MTILFISHKYPPFTGGMEKFSYELINGIRASCRTHIICYSGGESKLMWFLKLRSRVNHMLMLHPDIDIIHLNDGLMTYFGLWIKRKYNKPIVSTFHGLDLVFPLPYFQKKVIPRFNILDGFVCVSEATKQAAISRGVDASKIVVIKNGIDHALAYLDNDIALQDQLRNRYLIPKHHRIIIGVGRSVKRKGFSWFVSKILPALPDDVTFVLCGPNSTYDGMKWRQWLPDRWVTYAELMLGLPSDDAPLKQLQKQFPSRFIKTGYVTNTEMQQWLKMAEIFVMPNIKIQGDMEGFGLVALEASISNCVVLASKIDGITDAIIDQKNGYLIAPENAQAWIDGITTNLYDDNLEDKALAMKEYTMRHYSWQIMCDEYTSYFRNLVSRKDK